MGREMIEDAQVILEYLPSYYRSEKEQEYVSFLWDSFKCNYENGKYQFAFIAYHMLFMLFTYFCVWKIKTVRHEDFSKCLIGCIDRHETDLAKVSDPFGFWIIGESQFIRFLRLIGLQDRIGKYKEIIKLRNDSAHANGNVYLNSQGQIDDKINEILSYVEEIQQRMPPVLLSIFEKSLKEEESDFQHFEDELLRKHYFSQQDMKACSVFDFDAFISSAKGKKRLARKIADAYRAAYTEESGVTG